MSKNFAPTRSAHAINHSRYGDVTVYNIVVERVGAAGAVELRAVNGQAICDFDNEMLRKVANPEWQTPLEADIEMPDEVTAIVIPRKQTGATAFPDFDTVERAGLDGTLRVGSGEPHTWQDVAEALLADLPSFDECAQVIPFFDGTAEGEPITWKVLGKMMLEDLREAKTVEASLRSTIAQSCGCI